MIKEKKTGQLIVISSPSGGGKGSVIAGLLKNDNKGRWLSVSTTSSAIWDNDIPGVTYNFVSKEEFEQKIDEGYFLEYTNYVGNYYGTPKEFIREKLNSDDKVYDPRKIIAPGKEAIVKTTKETMDMFGSTGKA